MITFYPGPSRVEDKIPVYVKDAFREGVLSMNHRSPEFMALCKKTVTLLKQKLNIPKDYTIYFTSSATEGWEILAQSLAPSQSIHIYNGSFGEKWFTYTKKLRPDSLAITFDRESLPDPPTLIFKTGNVICLTQNETSNGSQLPDALIQAIQNNNPNHLIAVDAVSSLAGIKLNFSLADVWISSVQKCFGLPAGLGLMILSPKAVAQLNTIGENSHYNSLTLMDSMMKVWQTSYTPNVMSIYLLRRVMEDRPPIAKVHAATKGRFEKWQDFFRDSKSLKILIDNNELRSYTVLAIRGNPELIAKIKSVVRRNGFLLGEGYGELKKDTFRIANFPALKDKEIRGLMGILKRFL